MEDNIVGYEPLGKTMEEKFILLPTSERIKFLMALRGLTQQDMADLMGITRQSFNAWLHKDSWLTRLEKISNVLDVPLKSLIK